MITGFVLIGLTREVSANYWDDNFDANAANCDTAVLDSEYCHVGSMGGEGVYKLLALGINILTGLIGVACTVGLVWSGIIWVIGEDYYEVVVSDRNVLSEIINNLARE